MEVLKVSTKSNPDSVAGALAGVLRESGTAELQAIGAVPDSLNTPANAPATEFGLDFVDTFKTSMISTPFKD